MAEPVILNAEGVARLTLKTAVTAKVGDLIGHDGTDWVLADADGRIPATFMAMQYGVAEAIAVCRGGVLFDSDAPYTAGNDQYLSATAGAHTATIPAVTTTLTILQRIGKALTTSEMAFSLVPRGPTVLRASAAVNPASGATDTVQNLAVTITGILSTDYVYPHPPALVQGVVFVGPAVPTADTVTLGIGNASAGTVDGASLTWEFEVHRF